MEAVHEDGKGDTTMRQVAVLSVGHQYFTGYCLLRDDIRTFKVSRLVSLALATIRIQDTSPGL